MHAFWAVIDDLVAFVWTQLSGATVVSSVVPTSADRVDSRPVVAVMESVPEAAGVKVVHEMAILQIGEVYFIGEPNTIVYLDPVITFDNAAAVIPYGQKVRIQELRGRWALVTYEEQTGWVFKDVLCPRIIDVCPQLIVGNYYGADDTETKKLRACIDDLFAGSVGGYPLNAAEYVQYRLVQQRRFIPWGSARFRIAGTWQRKLRGVPGIHIGVRPRTNAVMEYVNEDIGHLAFVDAVYADGSIKVSSVGTVDEGIYLQQEWSESQWRELRPVFISVP